MTEKASRDISQAADSPNALQAFKGAVKAISEESPEILTGILAQVLPPALIPVRMFHATAKGHFLKQLMIELEALRKTGQINEDYLKSEQAWACFSDLLDYIDKISPDPKRFEAIRNAFLRTLKGGATGHDAPYQQQILRVVCDLSAGEIVALAAIYKLGQNSPSMTVESWLCEVANASGLLRAEIVEGIEQSLMAKRLILSRKLPHPQFPPETPKIEWGQKNRLTVLGVEVCEKIVAPSGR